jgi:ribosomal protein S18 acetylase RimI-like enzyme
MDDRLTRQALKVNWRNLALGHNVSKVDGATFVRNTTLPDIYDANFVFDVTVSESPDIDRLLTLTALEYAHAPRLTFRLDPFTPPAFEARLALEGYERSETLLLLLEEPLRRAASQFQILPIADEAGWTAYAELKRLDCREHAAIAHRLISSSKLKCPPVQYMLAFEDGRAVGHCSTWEGLEAVGQVEDLFVHPAYRRRGIGRALIHHCVESARARGAGAMVIAVDTTNTAKHMYVALGWRPIALCRQYSKKIGATVRASEPSNTVRSE